jgi:purine-binding chemotaxis protein CheW
MAVNGLHVQAGRKGLIVSAGITTIEPLGKAAGSKGGKYLTFALGYEEYGLEILKVREIIGCVNITAVPRMPPHIKGVINLRGQVISVIDLRARFGMSPAEQTDQTCIIVVEIKKEGRKLSFGIIVDSVSEVLSIGNENIEPSPEFGSSVEMDFILGIGKVGSSVKILLDIDKVLGGIEVSPPAQARMEPI